jgi:hypothetical protein
MPRSTEDSLRAVAKALLNQLWAESPYKHAEKRAEQSLWGKDREVFRALVAEMEAKS